MESTTVDALRARLADVKGRWPDVAALAGVSIKTLRKFAQGYTENPRIDTFEKIVSGLEQYEDYEAKKAS